MDFDKLNKWMTLGANLGVVAGLVFLAFEVQTNTQANRLAVLNNLGEQYFQGHAQIAENGELAGIVVMAHSGGDLTDVEQFRYRSWVFMRVSRVTTMLRAYDVGVVSESDMRTALRAIRDNARNYPSFRSLIEPIDDERLHSLLLDDDGLDKWL